MKRSKSQVWLLWNDEANPVISAMDDFNFNWTISFKTESEASLGAYGYYSSKSETMSEQEFENLVENNFNSRAFSSVWIVSNCVSTIRNQFAVDLATYSPVNNFLLNILYLISLGW